MPQSFSATPKPVKINRNHIREIQTDPAYDRSLEFSQPLDTRQRENRRSDYSIDPVAIAKKLRADDLDSLAKITIGGRYAHTGIGLWEVGFNLIGRNQLAACVFVASRNARPLAAGRIAINHSFVDSSQIKIKMSVALAEKGDIVAIGLHDKTTTTTHILLYRVASNCVVPGKGVAATTDAKGMIPAVNCDLVWVFSLDAEGVGDELKGNTEEILTSEEVTPLMTWVFNQVADIVQISPWRPQFQPLKKTFNRGHLEQRLLTDIADSVACDYNDFEIICRQIHDVRRDQAVQIRRAPKTERSVKQPPFPEVEVVTYESGQIYAAIIDCDGVKHKFLFDKDSMGYLIHKERHFVNADINTHFIHESSDVLVLWDKNPAQEKGVLRYFEVRF